MATREIPREQWAAFLDGYTRHRRWRLVNLEILDPEGGVGVQARSLPLEGIVAEIRHGHDELEIAVGGGTGEHLWHRIAGPTRIWLRQAGEDGPETMEIESASGVRTLVHMRPYLLPAVPG